MAPSEPQGIPGKRPATSGESVATPIDRLLAGHRRFRSGYYEANRERLVALARLGQSPEVAVVACCDSRVDPAVITDCTPGEMFVIRNVASLIPPCEEDGTWHGTSAALQFAVCGLEVTHLVVMGHSGCGGIRTLMEGPGDPQGQGFVSAWMSLADGARDQVVARGDLHTEAERLHACTLAAIEISLTNLRTFPWIESRLAAGRLALHGWYYDTLTGDLTQVGAARRA